MKMSRSRTGSALMYWLMLQEPATRQSLRGSVMPVAIAHASMSNKPPATGVPSRRPVARAAARVTVPQISADPRTGGSIPATSDSPNAESSRGSKRWSWTFIRLVPEESVTSENASPVSL